MRFPGTKRQAGALPGRTNADTLPVASITDAPSAGDRRCGAPLSANSTMS
jgi:hypothetical protein